MTGRRLARDNRTDPRAFVLARIAAVDASRDSAVQKFRSEVLRGKLIKPERARDWIARAAKSDGPPTEYITAPLDSEGRPMLPNYEGLSAQGRSLRALELAAVDMLPSYSKATIWHYGPQRASAPLEETPVRANGRLGYLRRVAQHLVRVHGWHDFVAVDFVLTGVIPGPSMWTVELPDPAVPIARRLVTLRVRPVMSPEQVARVYLEARGKMSARGGKQVLSEKHCELAAFAYERNDGRSWSDALREWNETFTAKDWAYGDRVQHFARDARAAVQRITGDKLSWVGDGAKRRRA